MDARELRENVLKLMKSKDAIESEIQQQTSVLFGNGVGMVEPMIDTEGYPRQDIDIYQVRHARQRIICLKNDLKDVMKQIEEGLYAVHAAQRGSGSDVVMEDDSSVQPPSDPIALINEVTPDSPAADAGLETSDQILEFGTVNSKNFKSLQDIAQVVQHSVGRPVMVQVRRKNRVVRICLTPKLWNGRGLLGCNIVPTETVDR